MNRTKVDFILELLEDKKLSPSHRERLYPLILSEIRQAGDADESILKEIEEIKRHILPKQENVEDKNDEIKEHNPVQTADALKLFKNGNNLKWITHIFPNSDDDLFEYNRITVNAIAEFNSISRRLPKKLAALISVFLKPPNDPRKKSIWYLGRPYKTWWSDEIKNWCNQHPGLHPDTHEILSQEIITPFKKSIEIRTGDEFKEALTYRLTSDNLNKVELDFSGLKKSTRFFTGVDDLMTGVACLFKPIIKRKGLSDSVLIGSAIQEVNGKYATVLNITHVNSICDHDYTGNDFISGDLSTARDKFLSLCDWNITANFSNGTFRVPILGEFEVEEKGELVRGFTHQLIFY